MKSPRVLILNSMEQFAKVMRHIDDTNGFSILSFDDFLLLAIHYKQNVNKEILSVIARHLMRWHGVFVITVSGLFHDKREVYEVPEAQQIVLDIGQRVPSLISNPHMFIETRRWMVCAEALALGGTVQNLGTTGRVRHSMAGDQPEMLLRVGLPQYARDDLVLARDMLEKQHASEHEN